MDTSWWLALAAVVVLALIVAVSDSVGRIRARHDRTHPPARPSGVPAGPKVRPRAGEIWWVEVPDEDGPESEGAARSASGSAAVGDGRADRPCLVLRVHGGAARVAEITTKYHDERAGVIPLPPGAVGDTHGRTSFLETDELREVPVWGFRRRVGVVDPTLWDQVQHLAE
ncbi:type II toxin-antitoxin system PemK/MazF family toxin [Streptomyces sp. NPDC002851]